MSTDQLVQIRDVSPWPAPSDAIRTYHAMVKPVSATCNIDCTYCFYLHKQQLLGSDSKFQMSEDILEIHIRQYIEGHDAEQVVFSWQGGEPTLLGLEFFEKVVELENKYKKPSLAARRNAYTCSEVPVTGIPFGDSPNLLNTSFTITADVDVPQNGLEGMRVTAGGRFGGYGFYVLKGKPVFTWNLLDLKRVKWQSPEALTPGNHTLEHDFKYDGLGFATLAFNNMSGIGRPGTGTLKVDGNVVATQTMEKSIPLIFTVDETFDIGSDTGSPIDDQDYQVSFNFTGKIDNLTISVEPPQITPVDIRKLKQAEMSAADAQ